jgi:hypothetical protein
LLRLPVVVHLGAHWAFGSTCGFLIARGWLRGLRFSSLSEKERFDLLSVVHRRGHQLKLIRTTGLGDRLDAVMVCSKGELEKRNCLHSRQKLPLSGQGVAQPILAGCTPSAGSIFQALAIRLGRRLELLQLVVGCRPAEGHQARIIRPVRSPAIGFKRPLVVSSRIGAISRTQIVLTPRLCKECCQRSP